MYFMVKKRGPSHNLYFTIILCRKMKRTFEETYLSGDEDWEQAIVQAVDQVLYYDTDSVIYKWKEDQTEIRSSS